MGLRFRKSIKIAPGVKVNFNKKSTSITFGDKGIHHTISSTGKKTTSAGIPGSGIYYTKTSQNTTTKNENHNPSLHQTSNGKHPKESTKWYKKTGWIIFFLIFLAPLGIFLMWKYKKTWKQNLKVVMSVCFAIWFIFLVITNQENPHPTNDNETLLQSQTTSNESSHSNSTEKDSLYDTETTELIQTEIIQTNTIESEPTIMVWINDTGTKYHNNPACSGMQNAYEITKEEALNMGKEACKKCY